MTLPEDSLSAQEQELKTGSTLKPSSEINKSWQINTSASSPPGGISLRGVFCTVSPKVPAALSRRPQQRLPISVLCAVPPFLRLTSPWRYSEKIHYACILDSESACEGTQSMTGDRAEGAPLAVCPPLKEPLLPQLRSASTLISLCSSCKGSRDP